jgi:hypothetical protein
VTDLELTGPLDLAGILDLAGEDGLVLVNGNEALVEGATGKGAPVLLPTPQAPANAGSGVTVLSSLGKAVRAAGTPLVTSGMVLQGDEHPPRWPGMVLPSTNNSAPVQVTAGSIPVNVVGDSATVFPNGGSATLDTSGQSSGH